MAKKLWIENIDIPAVLYQEATPTGDWLDKTSDAIAWDIHGIKTKDYLFVRYEIQMILFPLANPNYPTIDFTGWGSLTAPQKEIMTRHILAPYALRTTVYSDADDHINWFNLLDKTQGTPTSKYTGRALLIENMRRHVADKVRVEAMNMATTQTFFKDVFEMVNWYIAAATPDFMLWLTNGVGSAYENDGFAQKSYYTLALKNELMDIYNGV